MKKIYLLVLMCASAFVGEAQDIINYFSVGGEVTPPVTLSTGYGKIKIYGGEVLEGNISIYSAVDAKGKNVVNTTPKRTEIGTNKPTKRYYEFTTLYRSTTQPKTGGNGGTGGGTFRPLPPPPPADGFPNLQANILWSYHMGGMLTLQTDLGGLWGTYLQGGVGRNFFLKNPQKAISWMAEIGTFVNIEPHVAKFGVMVGRDQNHAGDLMMLFVGKYTYYLESFPWVGFSGALGAGFYCDDFGFEWDARLGVTFRFLADWEY